MDGQVDMDADVERFHPTYHGADVRMLISTVHPSRIVYCDDRFGEYPDNIVKSYPLIHGERGG